MGLPSIATSNQSGAGGAAGLTGIAGLFADGVEGYWYDPSDSATVYESYTDESNNTPATFGGKIGYVKDKSGYANNLVQTDASEKPTYGRIPADGDIRNLILDTATMDVTTANWQRIGTGYNPTATSITPPFTGMTVLELTHPSSQAYETLQGSIVLTQNTDVTFSVYCKYVTGSTAEGFLLSMNDGTQVIANFKDGTINSEATNVTSAISSVSNGFYRLTMSWNTGTGQRRQQPIMVLVDSNDAYVNVLSGTDTALICGYQIETGTSATQVQVTGANFNDVFEPTESHLQYFNFNGNGQGLSVSSNLGSTVDSLTLFAAFKAEDNTNDGNIVEFSDNLSLSTQAYRLFIDDSEAVLKYNVKGSLSRSVNTAISSYPLTALATAVIDLSDDYVRLYKDGTLEGSVNNDLGTGDFSANKDLNVGCRNANGTISSTLKGNIYQLVGSGQKITDTNNLNTINTIVAAKAGLTV